MHVFRPRSDLSRVLLCLAPLIGAALIAISRLEDYRHDVWDVTCGSLLGISMAYFSYRRYYPSLRSTVCDEPYPSRAAVAKLSEAGKMKDEEQRDWMGTEYAIDESEDETEAYPLNDIAGLSGERRDKDPGSNS